MKVEIETRAATPGAFKAILSLQRRSLRRNVSDHVAEHEGFISVEHTEELLERLNQPVPHSIAIDRITHELLGYALSMSPEHRDAMPDLVPMFAEFERLAWRGKPVADMRYTAMGQVCVAPHARGNGVFRKLYEHWFATQGEHYALGLTEIEASNTRSLGAHAAVGFEELSRYRQGHWTWVIVGRELGL